MRKLTVNGLNPIWKPAALVLMAMLGLTGGQRAHADPILLKAATTMVYGSSADTYSVVAPSAGTLTAQVSTVPWPVPLSSLSFDLSTATGVLSAPAAPTQAALLRADATAPDVETFQVGAGTYFAHVMATAGGDLNLGLYSVLMTFTPSAVPLPAACGLFLFAVLTLLVLRTTWIGPRNESVTYPT